MKTTYRFRTPQGREVERLEPWVPHTADIAEVTLFPALNDPEDPDDDDELRITLVVVPH